jgi:hypothetical protein
MIDKGVLPGRWSSSLYTTFLASAFRSIRFGVTEAHGKGIAIQLNYLLDQRGFEINSDGTFKVNRDRVKEGVTGLTREIMTIQAEGDYAKAKALGDRLGMVRPPVQKALDKLIEVRSTSSRDSPRPRNCRPRSLTSWLSIPSAG